MCNVTIQDMIWQAKFVLDKCDQTAIVLASWELQVR